MSVPLTMVVFYTANMRAALTRCRVVSVLLWTAIAALGWSPPTIAQPRSQPQPQSQPLGQSLTAEQRSEVARLVAQYNQLVAGLTMYRHQAHAGWLRSMAMSAIDYNRYVQVAHETRELASRLGLAFHETVLPDVRARAVPQLRADLLRLGNDVVAMRVELERRQRHLRDGALGTTSLALAACLGVAAFISPPLAIGGLLALTAHGGAAEGISRQSQRSFLAIPVPQTIVLQPFLEHVVATLPDAPPAAVPTVGTAPRATGLTQQEYDAIRQRYNERLATQQAAVVAEIRRDDVTSVMATLLAEMQRFEANPDYHPLSLPELLLTAQLTILRQTTDDAGFANTFSQSVTSRFAQLMENLSVFITPDRRPEAGQIAFAIDSFQRNQQAFLPANRAFFQLRRPSLVRCLVENDFDAYCKSLLAHHVINQQAQGTLRGPLLVEQTTNCQQDEASQQRWVQGSPASPSAAQSDIHAQPVLITQGPTNARQQIVGIRQAGFREAITLPCPLVSAATELANYWHDLNRLLGSESRATLPNTVTAFLQSRTDQRPQTASEPYTLPATDELPTMQRTAYQRLYERVLPWSAVENNPNLDREHSPLRTMNLDIISDIIEIEGLENHPNPLSLETIRRYQSEWRQFIERLRQELNNQRASDTEMERIDYVRTRVLNEIVRRRHFDDSARTIDQMHEHGLGASCQSRLYLILGAIQTLNLPPPPGMRFAMAVFADHVEPILVDTRDRNRRINLSSGTSTAADDPGPSGPARVVISSPAELGRAFLTSRNRNMPRGAEYQAGHFPDGYVWHRPSPTGGAAPATNSSGGSAGTAAGSAGQSRHMAGAQNYESMAGLTVFNRNAPRVAQIEATEGTLGAQLEQLNAQGGGGGGGDGPGGSGDGPGPALDTGGPSLRPPPTMGDGRVLKISGVPWSTFDNIPDPDPSLNAADYSRSVVRATFQGIDRWLRSGRVQAIVRFLQNYQDDHDHFLGTLPRDFFSDLNVFEDGFCGHILQSVSANLNRTRQQPLVASDQRDFLRQCLGHPVLQEVTQRIRDLRRRWLQNPDQLILPLSLSQNRRSEPAVPSESVSRRHEIFFAAVRWAVTSSLIAPIHYFGGFFERSDENFQHDMELVYRNNQRSYLSLPGVADGLGQANALAQGLIDAFNRNNVEVIPLGRGYRTGDRVSSLAPRLADISEVRRSTSATPPAAAQSTMPPVFTQDSGPIEFEILPPSTVGPTAVRPRRVLRAVDRPQFAAYHASLLASVLTEVAVGAAGGSRHRRRLQLWSQTMLPFVEAPWRNLVRRPPSRQRPTCQSIMNELLSERGLREAALVSILLAAPTVRPPTWLGARIVSLGFAASFTPADIQAMRTHRSAIESHLQGFMRALIRRDANNRDLQQFLNYCPTLATELTRSRLRMVVPALYP